MLKTFFDRRILNRQNRQEAPREELQNLLSRKAFRSVLLRERALADRSGRRFAVIAIDVSASGEQTLPKIMEHLESRLRVSDVVGWFDSTRIGVLLPQTPDEGARLLASRIVGKFSEQLPFKVFDYPKDGFRISRDDSRETQDGFPEGSPGDLALLAHRNGSGLEKVWTPRYPLWKRALDVAGAGFAFLLIWPLLLMVSLWIKITSSGPVLFKQRRIGFKGTPFFMYKFRSMHLDADHHLHRGHVEDLMNDERPMTKLDSSDPRLIPLAGLLRDTGMDELPQLINVIMGEMSLVGPRPCLPYEARKYLLWENRRFDAMPGMTGLWQVNGKNQTTFRQMMRYDVSYVSRRSFWVDLKILFKTLPALWTQASRKKSEQDRKISSGGSSVVAQRNRRTANP